MARPIRFARLNALAVCVLAVCSPLTGQFFNRATWLGIEEESIRPNFPREADYYVDRQSYVLFPAWDDTAIDWFRSGYSLGFGSTSSRRFTVESHLHHTHELRPGTRFHHHWIQSENRDTQFFRNAFGLEQDLSEETSLYFDAEVLPDKGNIDISVGAYFLRSERGALRVMVTAVDAPADKSVDFQYESRPYALMLSGWAGEEDSFRARFELGAQFPFELTNLSDDSTLELERYILRASGRAKVREQSWLIGSLELEHTQKEARQLTATDPLREDFLGEFEYALIEWWQEESRIDWSIGMSYLHQRLRGIRPNDPAADLREDREEWLGIARCRMELASDLFLDPQLFAGYVRFDSRDATTTNRSHGFEGKFGAGITYRISPSAHLTISSTLELDGIGFGGGGAQLVATF